MSKETKQNWREEQAKEEIGHTEISRSLSVFITLLFLAVLLIVPFIQAAKGIAELREKKESVSLGFLNRFNGVGMEMKKAWQGADSLLDRFLGPNAALLGRIIAFQSAMDDSCVFSRVSTGPVQEFLCRLGAGNEKAFVGRDGWLFFEPGVKYVSGPGFLDSVQLRKRLLAGDEVSGPIQPDPVKCIVHFRDQLKSRGIELVVVPAPVKPSIHPEKLSSRYEVNGSVLQNISYDEFVSRLEENGVHIFDPAPLLAEASASGPVYLETDTHWRPESSVMAAAHLAKYIKSLNIDFPEAKAPVRGACVEISSIGDVAAMLKLPKDQKLYPEEKVTVLPVTGSESEDADVLLMGDSFANIYSAEEMGWGADAGFGEQLAFELGRPVHRIIRNDAGAYATRLMLAKEMLRGKDVLQGKRVVVWEFAARELSVGDWKMIELVQGKPVVPEDSSDVNAEGVIVSGVVADVSDRPAKGAPYRDFIMKFYLEKMVDEKGDSYQDGDGVIHVFGMKDREILPVAATQVGMNLNLRIRPWSEVEKRYGTLKSGALGDMMLEIDKKLYWGEVLK